MVTRAIYKAREQFLTDGHIGHDLETAGRPDVLRSWRRSRLSGARAELPGLPLLLDESSESALTLAAEPPLARLAEQFSGLCAGVLLSDRNARILRRWAPDLESLQRMDKTCSAAGASGAEAVVGTNGIGTVTEERRARMVVGPEHFAEVFMDHVCIGAPIHHPLSRRFEGVVTLSAGVEVSSPLLLPLVMGTAREIEQRLLEQASRKERTLLDAFLSASRRGAAAAVIGEGVFMVGPRASRLLSGLDPSALWVRLREEIPGTMTRTVIALDVAEVSMHVTCEPLRLDGHLVGAVLDVTADVDPVGYGAAPPPRTTTPEPSRDSAKPAGDWAYGRSLLPGRSATWTELLTGAAAQVGQSTPLVVLGEPGTGKLTLLRILHAAAGHAPDTFRLVDGATATESLASTIHGPQAGTLVIRRLDALDPGRAAALATALEAGRAGDGWRVVATTTSPDAHKESAEHRRLFDELAVARLEVPPLRRRSEDIPELVSLLAARHGSRSLRFSTTAMVALQRAPWPGNVRQLDTVIRGLIAGGSSREVSVEMLPPEIGSHSRRRPLTLMEQLELDAILTALRRTLGNKVLAAQTLGISRSTLYRKMSSYQLDPDLNFF